MDRSNFDPQVGDSVRIRSWEDMESEFGIDEDGNIPCKFSFTEYMKDMCGDEFTITKIHDGKYSGHEKEMLCCLLICSNLFQKKKSMGLRLMIS